jgi:hypothetical protein
MKFGRTLVFLAALSPLLLQAQEVRVSPALDSISAIQRRAIQNGIRERFPAEWNVLSDLLNTDRVTLHKFRDTDLTPSQSVEVSGVIDHVERIGKACVALEQLADDAALPSEVTTLLNRPKHEKASPTQTSAGTPEEPEPAWMTGRRWRNSVSVLPVTKPATETVKAAPSHQTPVPPANEPPAFAPDAARAQRLQRAQMASAVPPNLYEGIRAYCNGKYAQALDLLGQKQSVDGPYRAQIALFRAAARFSKYAIDRDETLRQALIEDIREYRRLEPNQVLDSRFFSPGFRAFVAKTSR